MYILLNIRVVPILLLIISGCQAKPPDDNFPIFEFRSNPEMLGDSAIFEQFSIRLPKAFNKLDLYDLDRLKKNIKNDQNSYFQIELINGFSDQDNSAILVSRINESNVLLKLDEGYLDYLLSVPQTNNIKKSTFTLNGIKTVQYQINHEKLTNIKLFLFINGQTKCLDYFINNQMFDKKLEGIESSLSTLRIN